MERNYYLLSFESTHAAMAAQRGLAGRLSVQVVPTLRQVSASCGISLRVEERDGEKLAQALETGAVGPGEYRLYWVEENAVREIQR